MTLTHIPVEQTLTSQEVARVVRVSTKTLANWRYLGDRGPAWIKAGGMVRYPVSRFRDYIQGAEGGSRA